VNDPITIVVLCAAIFIVPLIVAITIEYLIEGNDETTDE